jgi:hypothetical protein
MTETNNNASASVKNEEEILNKIHSVSNELLLLLVISTGRLLPACIAVPKVTKDLSAVGPVIKAGPPIVLFLLEVLNVTVVCLLRLLIT